MSRIGGICQKSVLTIVGTIVTFRPVQTNILPRKLSQRVQLPADFLTQAEADAVRVGLSLPTLLGLAARRAWQATVESFIGEPMPAAARAAVGLPTAPRRVNRRKGVAL